MKITNTQVKIDFTGFNQKWIDVAIETALEMGMMLATFGKEENVIEFSGSEYKVELFRKLIEMSDGGAIVE